MRVAERGKSGTGRDTLGAVTLKGYNIVGDGTPQAFIPILTAQTEEELPLTRKRYPPPSHLTMDTHWALQVRPGGLRQRLPDVVEGL